MEKTEAQKQYELELLRNWLDKLLGSDADKFDLESEIDYDLTLSENKNLIEQKINHLIEEQYDRNSLKAEQEKAEADNKRYEGERQKENSQEHISLDKVSSVGIIGDRNSGKTNLAFYILRNYAGKRKIYLLGYPKQVDNFKSLNTFNELFQLTDSIIFCDELQRFIKVYDRQQNNDLMELISFFSHQNNTLMFTTQLSQFITKGVEAFIDCWMITRLGDLATLKNGSKPKRIIQNTIHPKCSKWALSLDNGEFLEYSEMNEIGMNGIKEFPFQSIQKDWKLKKTEKNFNKNSEKKIKKVED